MARFLTNQLQSWAKAGQGLWVAVPSWGGSGELGGGIGNDIKDIWPEESGLSILEPTQARLALRRKGLRHERLWAAC